MDIGLFARECGFLSRVFKEGLAVKKWSFKYSVSA
jgi:hypothetical protein